jgi:CMP/dCMP kinase
MIVAVDGPAGVGKSTVSRIAAQRTGMMYLNSGNVYRACTSAALCAGVNPEDDCAVLNAAYSAEIFFRNGRIHVDGHDVQDSLHSDSIDEWVARHAAITPLREHVIRIVREMTENKNAVIEGRDIGTVVYPTAPLKIYLDAAIEVRALRRFKQGTSGKSLEALIENIRMRDSLDVTRQDGRLQIAKDAVYIDTSYLTIDEVCDRVVELILEYQE